MESRPLRICQEVRCDEETSSRKRDLRTFPAGGRILDLLWLEQPLIEFALTTFVLSQGTQSMTYSGSNLVSKAWQIQSALMHVGLVLACQPLSRSDGKSEWRSFSTAAQSLSWRLWMKDINSQLAHSQMSREAIQSGFLSDLPHQYTKAQDLFGAIACR